MDEPVKMHACGCVEYGVALVEACPEGVEREARLLVAILDSFYGNSAELAARVLEANDYCREHLPEEGTLKVSIEDYYGEEARI